jgi:hypothetical protein
MQLASISSGIPRLLGLKTLTSSSPPSSIISVPGWLLTLPTHLALRLYIQANNCYAENKIIYVFAFLSLLTALDIFRDIKMSFLIVGHTHEDIDQLFSSAQTKFRTASVHTPVYVPPLQLDLALIRLLLLLCCLYFHHCQGEWSDSSSS